MLDKKFGFRIINDSGGSTWLMIDKSPVFPRAFRKEFDFFCSICEKFLTSDIYYEYTTPPLEPKFIHEINYNKLSIHKTSQICLDCYDKICFICRLKNG